jgi:hypothetical protein
MVVKDLICQLIIVSQLMVTSLKALKGFFVKFYWVIRFLFEKATIFHLCSWLQDGLFSYQTPLFGLTYFVGPWIVYFLSKNTFLGTYILEGLKMESVCIFYGQLEYFNGYLEYFTALW